ncbi:hypothetical protein B296_00052461 [Ensete ventricosum]|uniref:Uncharacterized protein n=1 Tax=Ensete ventricosum TaxID=4639 RepID=A0A426XJ50_ENSVE|nr:hypothetical protein B296_00052461 [Ensete ventricosum]
MRQEAVMYGRWVTTPSPRCNPPTTLATAASLSAPSGRRRESSKETEGVRSTVYGRRPLELRSYLEDSSTAR